VRVSVALIALLVASSGGLSGFCPMASANAADDGHDCCGLGISGKSPACCHAVASSSPGAVWKDVVLVPPAVRLWSSAADAPDPRAVTATLFGPLVSSHSPPLVLRI
jgi:hypothetical protein